MHSCLYEGRVRHRRFGLVKHEFSYRLFMLYLDLDELPTLFRGRWLWAYERGAPVAFRRGDYLGDPAIPLADAVRDLVAERTGRRPDGPIRLLTQLRHLGYYFNPLSVYFCFDRAGTDVRTIVAQVTNIPWGERHAYVLDAVESLAGDHRFAKKMHVSPFLPMALDYQWRHHGPGKRLAIRLDALAGKSPRLNASLLLSRREITGLTLARVLCRHPLMTARIAAAIHWQALRLWWKNCRVYAHPKHRLDSRKQAPS